MRSAAVSASIEPSAMPCRTELISSSAGVNPDGNCQLIASSAASR
jgi:hypothetical protein